MTAGAAGSAAFGVGRTPLLAAKGMGATAALMVVTEPSAGEVEA